MVKRPLIALDALLVGPEPTGVGRSILELVRALSSRDRGLDFTLLVTDRTSFREFDQVAHWSLVDCPRARGGSFRKALFTQWKLPGLCRELKVDVLHSLQFITPLRLACPRVVTVHDLAWKSYAGILQTSRRFYYDLLVPRSLKAAEAIVTNSESTAGDVRSFLPQLASRIHTTPFGTPSWVWQMADAGTRVPPQGDFPAQPYFLFVGTLEPRKNLERLLSAYELFVQECLAARKDNTTVPALVLAGARGWNDSGLRRKIRHLQKSGRLVILDYCSVERLWYLYRLATGLVFPSLHEGFGFPILEAMAAGCPVMTSGRGAMREVAGDAATFVVPENEASICRGLHALAFDQDGNDRRRQLGLARARRWDWEKTAATTCAVYRGILGLGESGNRDG